MIIFVWFKYHLRNTKAELKKGIACKKMCVGIFVFKTAQSLERGLIEEGNNLFNLARCRFILLWYAIFLRKQIFPMKYIFIAYLKLLL